MDNTQTSSLKVQIIKALEQEIGLCISKHQDSKFKIKIPTPPGFFNPFPIFAT